MKRIYEELEEELRSDGQNPTSEKIQNLYEQRYGKNLTENQISECEKFASVQFKKYAHDGFLNSSWQEAYKRKKDEIMTKKYGTGWYK